MEASALVYVGLTVITLTFALFVKNSAYVPDCIAGRVPGPRSRQQARNLVAEAAICCLLAGVSACRIGVGNDYWPYMFNFRLIAQGRYVSSELGFNCVVKWMQDLFGYNRYLPIFGLFAILTVLFFMRALHDQAQWYAASLFLLLTGGYYFNSLNSVRYYFVLAVALFSMKYVLRGEYGKFILWIGVAALFHKSVLLVIPVYLLAKWLSSVKLKRWHWILGGVLVLSLIFGRELYREIIFKIYPFYENSAFDTGGLSLTNIAKCAGTLVLSLICWKSGLKDNAWNRFYFFLNLGGLALYTFGSFIPEVSRVAYYLIISQVFLIPGLLAGMKKGAFRNLCIFGTAAAFLMYFAVYLYKAYDVSIRILPYRSWIFD